MSILRFTPVALGLLLRLAADARAANEAPVNVPTQEADHAVYNPMAISPMADLVGADEQSKFAEAATGPAVIFTEDRSQPIRGTRGLPKRWLIDTANHAGRFNGNAQPGEFYVFQLGAFAAKRDLVALSLVYSDLKNGKVHIPASNFRCFNLGGTGAEGKPLTQVVAVGKGWLLTIEAPTR